MGVGLLLKVAVPLVAVLVAVYRSGLPSKPSPPPAKPWNGEIVGAADDPAAVAAAMAVLRRPPASVEEMVRAAEEREVELRRELSEKPASGRLQAKLAQSLLETNGSRFVARPERLDEGRSLVEKAAAAAPDRVSTLLAQVALLLAERNAQPEAATPLAEKAVSLRQSPRTQQVLGQVYLADGCAHVCRVWAAVARLEKDRKIKGSAVYPEGKEPKVLLRNGVEAAAKKLVDAGKRLHASVDNELYSKLGKHAPEAAVRAALEPIAPLLQLAAAMEAKQGGVHYRTLAAIGGCRVYEGRRINGKVCPKEPKEKAKRPPPEPEPPEPEPEPEPKEPQRKKYHGRDW